MRELKKLCKDRGVTAKFTQIAERSNGSGDWAPGSRHYVARLAFQGRELETEYSIGSGIKAPNVEDLVASLLLDASHGRDSFEDFCGNCGYDTDSRKAHATWLACGSADRDVKFLFGLHLQDFEAAAADW